MALWSYFNVTSNYIWPRLWTVIIKYMNCVMFCTFFNNLYDRTQLHGAISRNNIFHDSCDLPRIAEMACQSATVLSSVSFPLCECSAPNRGKLCLYFGCTLIILRRNSEQFNEIDGICTLLPIEMFSGPDKRWPHQGEHLNEWANYIAQKPSGPPESCSGYYWKGLSVFAFIFAILSLPWLWDYVFGCSSREDLFKTRKHVSTKFGKICQCDSFWFWICEWRIFLIHWCY